MDGVTLQERFIETPGLPTTRVSLAVVDGRISKEVEAQLYKLEIRCIRTSACLSTYEAISGHPDIQIHHLGGNCILVAPSTGNSLVYALEENGFRIIVGKKPVGTVYPGNIAYNAARVGKYLICNHRYTDEVLLEEMEKRDVMMINTRQGYAKCSICVVSQHGIITSDAGIQKDVLAAIASKELFDCGIVNTVAVGTHTGGLQSKLECCLIEPGHILLPGMKYGFIGGASGKVSCKAVAFYGRLSAHPSIDKIYAFLKKHATTSVELDSNTLIDHGTLIPLKEYSILTQQISV